LLIASQEDFAVVIDKGWAALWHRRMADPLTDAESLKIDASGCICDIGKKVRSLDEIQGQYIGLFKISRDCLAKVSAFYKTLDKQAIYDGKPFEKMFMTSFIQQLIESGMPVKPVYTTHGWLEVDTYEDWQFYEALPPDDALFRFDSFNDRVLANR
jgi:choline kinase